MSAHKTAALLSCAGVLGAVLGGADDRRVEALRTFGWELGGAFQAVDDALAIWAPRAGRWATCARQGTSRPWRASRGPATCASTESRPWCSASSPHPARPARASI